MAIYRGSGGSVEGITESDVVTIAISQGGTGANTAAGARTNLGLGTAATTDASAYATAAQGTLADSAVQPGDISEVATSNSYNDLDDLPTLGTAAATDADEYATAAQGALADSAVQPADIGTAAAEDVGYFATAAQGSLADSALQSDDIGVSIQAYDAQLADVAGLTATDNGVIIGNGTNFVVESGSTLRTSLGLAIGTDVLAPNGSAASLTSFPTLNQNTTGTADNVTGVVAIANGGTGQTTAVNARAALLPAYATNAGKVLAVKADASDVEYIAVGGSGTVTSVGMSVPTGLSVSGSPVTTSGTLAVTYASGYAIPTTAKQTEWDNAVHKTGDETIAGVKTFSDNIIGAGNLTLSGTAKRITGDFSNATFANRAAFQSSTTNGATQVTGIPNGTATTASFVGFNNSDPTNSSFAFFGALSTEARITSGIAGTGTYLPMTFYTGGSERMRVDTSGNVGVGTSSTVGRLRVSGSDSAVIGLINGASYGVRFGSAAGLGAYVEGVDIGGVSSYQPLIVGGSDVRIATGGTERMRIDSSGNLLVGTASAIGSNKLVVKGNSSLALQGASSTYTGDIGFYDTSSVLKWGISTNQSNFYIADSDFSNYAYLAQNFTNWSFASDLRLKKDVEDLEYGLATVLAIQPRRYTFVSSDKSDIGFIAQELREVVPEAVSGEEIEFDEADTPQERAAKSLGVGKETLIPILVKAIQEQQALITQLQADVAALKGN